MVQGDLNMQESHRSTVTQASAQKDWEANYDLAWPLLIGVLVRIFAQTNLLNLFYNYGRTEGGNFILKISPGSYIIFIVCAIALTRASAPMLRDFKVTAQLLCAVVVGGIAFTISIQQPIAVGYLFDSYLSAGAAVYTLGKLGPRGRRLIFDGVLVGLMLNEIVLLLEYVSHRHFIPVVVTDDPRPAAFLNHPLLSGLFYATAVPLVMLHRSSLIFRIIVAVLFTFATFISGARISSIFATLGLITSVILAFRREGAEGGTGIRAFITQIIIVAFTIPAIAILAFSAGVGSRLAGGLVDKSSMTRLLDYQLLSYLNTNQLMKGIGAAAGMDWSQRLMGTPSIESSLVLGIFMYGLPYTLFYLSMVVIVVFMAALRGDNYAKIACLSFLVIALSNNTLSSKNPSVLFLLVIAGSTITLARSRRTQAIGTSLVDALKFARSLIAGGPGRRFNRPAPGMADASPAMRNFQRWQARRAPPP